MPATGGTRRATIRDIAERAGVSKGAVSYALNGRPGRLRRHARPDPRDRRRARLVPEPRGPRALRRARGRVRPRARPPGEDARARAVLHGVRRRRRVRALRALDRADDPARRRTSTRRSRSTDAGGASTASTASLSSTCASTTCASTSSSVSGCRPSSSAGRSRTAPFLRSGTTKPPSSSTSCAISPRSATRGSRTSRASESFAAHGGADAWLYRARSSELGLEAEVVQSPTTAPREAPARPDVCSPPPTPPTAILFDSDLLAVTGLGVAQQMGFEVPDDLSIVGWDDSLISQVVHPPLTAITRDIERLRDSRRRSHLLAVDRRRGDRGRGDRPR